jgi:hypothetical protein
MTRQTTDQEILDLLHAALLHPDVRNPLLERACLLAHDLTIVNFMYFALTLRASHPLAVMMADGTFKSWFAEYMQLDVERFGLRAFADDDSILLAVKTSTLMAARLGEDGLDRFLDPNELRSAQLNQPEASIRAAYMLVRALESIIVRA